MVEFNLNDVNWLAVVIAVVASMIIGAVWYSKLLFQKQWVAEIGKTEKELKSVASPGYAVAVVCGIIEAVFLSLLIEVMGSATALEGALAGLMVWVGFIGTTSLLSHIFQARSLKLWAIDYGNQLVVIVVMGAIIAGWPQ